MNRAPAPSCDTASVSSSSGLCSSAVLADARRRPRIEPADVAHADGIIVAGGVTPR